MDVAGKVAVLVGGSGGIGAATAKALAARGAKVAIAGRDQAKLDALAKEIPDSLAVVADARESESMRALMEAARRRFGRVDILVNLAGQGMWAQVAEIDPEEYLRLFDTNVCGALRAMRAAIPIMREQGGGSIVNVSSMLTRVHVPNEAGYASTKYALNDLTLTARAELAKDGIVVSLIRPKLVQNDFGRHGVRPEPDFLRDPSKPHPHGMDTSETVAEKIVELILSGEAEMDL